MKKIFAISSSGGHWTQLMALRAVLEKHRVVYCTCDQLRREDVHGFSFFVIPHFNKTMPFKFLVAAVKILILLLYYRPSVVVSTGAAPGVIAIKVGKFLGAKTIWLDSLANFDEVSMSARIAEPQADLYLTQWRHLSKDSRPDYRGSIL